MKLLRVLFLVFLFSFGGVLLWSVIKSGFSFQFNPDELFNANTVYLILKGYKPYVDFYTVYSPLFHWLLSPLFMVYGFTFNAVYAARVMMIMLYIVRLFLLFLLVKRVFNSKTALIAVILFLLDPFTVFAGMQIRPENLMMVVYTLFLLVFSYAVDQLEKSNIKYKISKIHIKNQKLNLTILLSGILCGLTLLINIKIIPSLAAFGIVFLFYALRNKKIPQLLLFINGFCLIFLAFFAYFLIKGYLPEMFLHVFLDPFKLNNSIPFPTWLGYFYFSNPTIYGIDGKPSNWMFAWALPLLGFAGGYRSLFKVKTNCHSGERSDSRIDSGQAGMTNCVMKIILFVSLIMQWFSMLFIHSVFIQYYIPLNWFFAIFGAVIFHDLLFEIKTEKILKTIIAFAILLVFVSLSLTSIRANINRSRLNWDPYLDEFTKVWQIIPEQSPAFPNVLFRRPIYPILWGSTFALYMRDRYPPAYLAIEKNNLPLLTFLNDEYFGYLDRATQDYILSHYKRDPHDALIWKRSD